MIAVHHENQEPRDMLENARDVLHFMAQVLAVPQEIPLDESAHHGLYLVLTGVENTITQAAQAEKTA